MESCRFQRSKSNSNSFNHTGLTTMTTVICIGTLLSLSLLPSIQCHNIDQEESDNWVERSSSRTKPIPLRRTAIPKEPIPVSYDDGRFKYSMRDADALNLAIVHKEQNSSVFSNICGGVRVLNGIALASASCFIGKKVRSPSNLYVVRENVLEVNRLDRVMGILRHPNYTDGSYYHDLAIIIYQGHPDIGMSPKLDFNNLVSFRTNLPNKTRTMALVKDTDKSISNPKSVFPAGLRFIPPFTQYILPVFRIGAIVSNEVCERRYRKYFAKKYLNFDTLFPRGIDESLICAFVNDPEHCEEENGHVLFTTISLPTSAGRRTFLERFTIIGTRARGSGKPISVSQCLGSAGKEKENLPGIYTSIPYHSAWVMEMHFVERLNLYY